MYNKYSAWMLPDVIIICFCSLGTYLPVCRSYAFDFHCACSYVYLITCSL